ncbi:hypothetical protein BU23DRAFT_118302 [Bimuria novae-zelandiae CBS 107.79]|uniref:Uncharacterized protein n=1 Tax=Bimuria novae-zelandiae CBS 107.79 TaxID=1447943 RepID=A0A6A5V9R1_9PLEO|nr:hypothetical protein BU23DRAFT_118302 [Bimuria novae-zelandiae CBS 107.79]
MLIGWRERSDMRLVERSGASGLKICVGIWVLLLFSFCLFVCSVRVHVGSLGHRVYRMDGDSFRSFDFCGCTTAWGNDPTLPVCHESQRVAQQNMYDTKTMCTTWIDKVNRYLAWSNSFLILVSYAQRHSCSEPLLFIYYAS